MKYFYKVIALFLITLIHIQCETNKDETEKINPKIVDFLSDGLKSQSKRYSTGPNFTKRFQDGYFINEAAYYRSRLKPEEALLKINNDRTSPRSDTSAFYHVNDSVFVVESYRGNGLSQYLFDTITQHLKTHLVFSRYYSSISHYSYSDKLDNIFKRSASVSDLGYDANDVAKFDEGREYLFTKDIDSLWGIVAGDHDIVLNWELKYKGNKETINLNGNLSRENEVDTNNNIVFHKSSSSSSKFYYEYEKNSLVNFKSYKYQEDSIVEKNFATYSHNSNGLLIDATWSHFETGDTVSVPFHFIFKKLEDKTTITEVYHGEELGMIYHFDEEGYWIKSFADSTFCLMERKLIKKESLRSSK